MPVNEKNYTLSAPLNFANHPAGHDSFTRAARSNSDHTLVVLTKFVANVVNELLLIGAKRNFIQDTHTFQLNSMIRYFII